MHVLFSADQSAYIAIVPRYSTVEFGDIKSFCPYDLIRFLGHSGYSQAEHETECSITESQQLKFRWNARSQQFKLTRNAHSQEFKITRKTQSLQSKLKEMLTHRSSSSQGKLNHCSPGSKKCSITAVQAQKNAQSLQSKLKGKLNRNSSSKEG